MGNLPARPKANSAVQDNFSFLPALTNIPFRNPSSHAIKELSFRIRMSEIRVHVVT